MNPIAQVSVCVEGRWKTLDLYPMVAVWPSLWPYKIGGFSAGKDPVKLVVFDRQGVHHRVAYIEPNSSCVGLLSIPPWNRPEWGIVAVADKRMTHDDSQGEDVIRSDNDDG